MARVGESYSWLSPRSGIRISRLRFESDFVSRFSPTVLFDLPSLLESQLLGFGSFPAQRSAFYIHSYRIHVHVSNHGPLRNGEGEGGSVTSRVQRWAVCTRKT